MPDVVSSPDFVTITTNAGVFLAAIGTVIAAIWTAVKKIKTFEDPKSADKVIGGSIMDNTTMLMWSESNRDVAEALRETQKELMELRFAVTSLKDKIK
jgi:hypothetical protein